MKHHVDKHPDSIGDPDEYLDIVRSRVTKNFCVLCFILAVFAVPASFFAKDNSTLVINCIMLVFYAVPLVIIRKIDRYEVAAKFFLITTMAATSANAVATNFSTALPTSIWYFVYMVFAYLVLNFRWMLAVVLFAFSTTTLFTILHLTALDQINPRYNEHSMLIGSPITMSVALASLIYLLTVYRRLRDVMFKKVLEANREKNRMVGIMSHDLRNYLGAIQGMCSVIYDDLVHENQSPSTQELRRNVGIIDQASVAAVQLVDEVVTAARDTSVRTLFLEAMNLGSFVSPIYERYRVLSQSKSVNFLLDIKNKAVSAPINKDAFSRVMENLLSNALKFTKANDTVTISIGSEGHSALISVTDTGIGIPQHLKEQLFTPFTKAGRPGTANEKSIGLGLSIVKNLVELHNGTIECESDVGKGSTFTVKLPLAGTGNR